MVKKRTTSGKAPISGASRQFGYVGYLHPTWPVANLGMWDTCTQKWPVANLGMWDTCTQKWPVANLGMWDTCTPDRCKMVQIPLGICMYLVGKPL